MPQTDHAVMVIAVLAVFVQESYALCKICNSSNPFERELNPLLYYYRRSRNIPTSRDVSYLPEETYDEENESMQTDQQRLERGDRSLMPDYRNLCETATKRVRLDDSEFEYQPPHYHEVYCKSYSTLGDRERTTANSSKQKCAHPGFHCVQRSRTLFMVRRRWESECWEPFTKEIASGCDCMWPVSILGDISVHY